MIRFSREKTSSFLTTSFASINKIGLKKGLKLLTDEIGHLRHIITYTTDDYGFDRHFFRISTTRLTRDHVETILMIRDEELTRDCKTNLQPRALFAAGAAGESKGGGRDGKDKGAR